MMDLNQQKEQFSIAYVRAVASVAGYNTYKPEVDDDSVDFGIAARGPFTTVHSPRLEMQLKCTSSYEIDEANLGFPLRLKNYDDLRNDLVMIPRLLVVVVVPECIDDWIEHGEEGLTLRRFAYWLSLRGRPETTNEKTVTVHLPKTKRFTVDALRDLMIKIGAGSPP
jgi:hypothetical protein